MSYSRFRNVDDDVGADILESAYMVSMLLYLYDNGESRKTDIYRALGRNNLIPDKLYTLREMGLVYFDGETSLRPVIGLTDLGSHVAARLREIDMAIRTSEVPDAPVGIQGC